MGSGQWAIFIFTFHLSPLTFDVSRLRLRGRSAEIHGDLDIFQILNSSVACFKALNIFGESFHKALRVLRRKNDAGFHFALRGTRHHIHKIYYESSMRVRDDRQVGI